jgi:hypothetical protein
VLSPRALRHCGAAVCLTLGLLLITAPSAHAQGGVPTKATPQATYAAPQVRYAAPQATYAVPQSFPSGQYASPQGYQPCACYFPQGYCPFPTGYCAFPQGNCIAVQPSGQWPVGTPQFGSAQGAAQSSFMPTTIGD